MPTRDDRKNEISNLKNPEVNWGAIDNYQKKNFLFFILDKKTCLGHLKSTFWQWILLTITIISHIPGWRRYPYPNNIILRFKILTQHCELDKTYAIWRHMMRSVRCDVKNLILPENCIVRSLFLLVWTMFFADFNDQKSCGLQKHPIHPRMGRTLTYNKQEIKTTKS